jgi:hypothetical protein
MSAANASIRAGSVIALPPYFTTTVLPWNRASHGSASMSVAAFASACLIRSSGSVSAMLRRSPAEWKSGRKPFATTAVGAGIGA